MKKPLIILSASVLALLPVLAFGNDIGEKFRDCDVCPEMIVVPAGEYLMGSPESEEGRFDNEGPVHRVKIAKPFAVGVYEVTFDEWDACLADGGCNGYRPRDRAWGRGRRPVIGVSWEDIQAYVHWLRQKTSKGYRLLSESEWEYVARAGTTTPFNTGDTISTEQANYNGNYIYGSGHKGEYRKQTVPVGSFAPNAFGLYDVHGNVYEWVEDEWVDHWKDNYNGAPSDGSAWKNRNRNYYRIVRGGSWFKGPENLRSACRHSYYRLRPDSRYGDIGFRLALTLSIGD